MVLTKYSSVLTTCTHTQSHISCLHCAVFLDIIPFSCWQNAYYFVDNIPFQCWQYAQLCWASCSQCYINLLSQLELLQMHSIASIFNCMHFQMSAQRFCSHQFGMLPFVVGRIHIIFYIIIFGIDCGDNLIKYYMLYHSFLVDMLWMWYWWAVFMMVAAFCFIKAVSSPQLPCRDKRKPWRQEF